MNRKIIYLIMVVGIAVTTLSYYVWKSQDQVAHNWRSAIQSCAQTDILDTSEYVFFGPSNNVPPGSIWRKTGNRGFALRWNINDIDSATSANRFTESGSWASCAFTMKLASTVNPSVFLDADLGSLSGSIASTLGKSSSVRIGFDRWRLDLLKEGPYFEHLMQSDSLSSDLGKEGRVIMHKAILIRGFFMELDFASNLHADLKAIVKKHSNTGGSKLTIKESSESTLRIESSGEVYIAGSFAEYSEIGVGAISQPPRLIPILVPVDAELTHEEQK